MGSWAKLTIGKTVFENWKDGIDPCIAVLFHESEKRVAPYPLPERDEEEDFEEERPLYVVEYVTTVPVLKKRLDFLGFTLDISRRAFEIGKLQEVECLKNQINQWQTRTDDLYRQLKAHSERNLELVLSADAESWTEAVREVVRSPWKKRPDEFRTLADFLQPSPEARFPGSLDPRFRLRFELELGSSDEEVVLDVTELVSDGYYSQSDPLTVVAFQEIPTYERERCHRIILTEGSTDKLYLESAFNLFHPELVSYVSFLDFNGWNVPGGASFLESMVRSFVAAGIRDRIVALFDNDTAGFAAHARLGELKLPSNVRVIRYPDIELARSFPTLGPSGAALMDVNGSAASIEIYLGEDVIRNQDGSLIPVQWKSFDTSLKKYQGEILDKRGCWQRFTEKIKKAGDNHPGDFTGPEWRDLLALTSAILNAFVDADGEELIEDARINASGATRRQRHFQ